MKLCPGCNNFLKGSCFHRDKRQNDGLQTWCKACNKERRIRKASAQAERDSS